MDAYGSRQWTLVTNHKAMKAIGFPGAHSTDYTPVGLTLEEAKQRTKEVLRERFASTQHVYPPAPTASSRRYLKLVRAN